jgi:hypothetical protein
VIRMIEHGPVEAGENPATGKSHERKGVEDVE